MSDKPLHVEVAEALGWRLIPLKGSKVQFCLSGGTKVWVNPHGEHQCERCTSLPRYDTDWAATGPLIEKYGIAISPDGAEEVGWIAIAEASLWILGTAAWGYDHGVRPFGSGATPLEAVCRLILAMKAEGKLQA